MAHVGAIGVLFLGRRSNVIIEDIPCFYRGVGVAFGKGDARVRDGGVGGGNNHVEERKEDSGEHEEEVHSRNR
jgi:hypothetical protein